jgi:hypothetical protein
MDFKEVIKIKNNIDGKLPTKEELFSLIERLKDLTEVEKENLKKSFERRAMNADAFMKIQQGKNRYFDITIYEYWAFVIMLLIVLSVFGKNFIIVCKIL